MNLKRMKDSRVSDSVSEYEFGCLMVDLDFPQVFDIHKKISSEDVYDEKSYGLEYNPHVTILYGIEPSLGLDSCVEFLKPLAECGLLATSLTAFEQQDYDVLKYDIVCQDLNRMNQDLREHIDYVGTFNLYHPHVTVAYLKKGTVAKYIQEHLDKLIELKAQNYRFSQPGKEDIKLKL